MINNYTPKIKRGFNQTPADLREKLYNETHPKKEMPKKEEVKPLDLRKTFNKLKRF